jgi:hypothetical protein
MTESFLGFTVTSYLSATGLSKLLDDNYWTIEVSSQSRCLPSPHLMTETDLVSETACLLEYRTMGKVQKPSDPECYTPSSEPFRIYYNLVRKDKAIPVTGHEGP